MSETSENQCMHERHSLSIRDSNIRIMKRSAVKKKQRIVPIQSTVYMFRKTIIDADIHAPKRKLSP